MRKTLAVSERRACRVLGQVRRTQRYTPRMADDEVLLTTSIVSLASAYGPMATGGSRPCSGLTAGA